MATYPDNGMAKAYAEYCLAWLEVQHGEYDGAIARLRHIMDDRTCDDTELYARTQFQIGRVYQIFLRDYDKAEVAFRKVISDYPNAKIVKHPFLDYLREKNGQ